MMSLEGDLKRRVGIENGDDENLAKEVKVGDQTKVLRNSRTKWILYKCFVNTSTSLFFSDGCATILRECTPTIIIIGGTIPLLILFTGSGTYL